METLYKCAVYYGDAETDAEFETARAVLAERIIRMFIPTAPKYPLRVTSGFDTVQWASVAESAIAVCNDMDATAALIALRDAGEKWIEVAKWTPEPWRVR